MFKHKRSQDGFGIVEALCFIVMFSMVGLIGWYVINENQNSQEILDNIGGAEVQTSSSKTATAGKKFTFKELGVQITLPEELKGLTYIKSDSGNSYFLNMSSFTQLKDKCGEEGRPQGFTNIFKENGQYENLPRGGDGGLLKQFDSFYIAYGDPLFSYQDIGECEQDNYDQLSDARSKLNDALKQAFKTATLVE